MLVTNSLSLLHSSHSILIFLQVPTTGPTSQPTPKTEVNAESISSPTPKCEESQGTTPKPTFKIYSSSVRNSYAGLPTSIDKKLFVFCTRVFFLLGDDTCNASPHNRHCVQIWVTFLTHHGHKLLKKAIAETLALCSVPRPPYLFG